MSLSLPDRCLVHRYLYYIKSAPVLSDYEYDLLERKAVREAPSDHPIHKPGSDDERDYPPHIVEAASNPHIHT